MRPHHLLLICVALPCCLALPARSQVVINEYVALNLRGLTDEFGAPEDWIELYNAGPDTVDLAGFGLSDDVLQPLQWVFPPALIHPDSFLVVFASGRDRRYRVNHWETIILEGSDWKYRPGDSEPPLDWRRPTFNDSSWATGPSGLGYGDGDDATIVPPTISLYLRHAFTIPDPDDVEEIYLHIDYDDAFVAYLNDVEIVRRNIGQSGDHPPFDQLADSEHEAVMYQGERPPPFAVRGPPPPELLVAGTNLLAIQVHNVAPDSDDLSLIPFLTLGLKQPPPAPSGVPDTLEINAAQLHTSFRIDADGEFLILADSTGAVLDQADSIMMYTDISRGRQPDGGVEWWYFAEPTPVASNITAGSAAFAAAPEFSMPAGFLPGGFELNLSSPSPTATIYFTLDGAEPTPAATPWTAPIQVDSTIVVRARAHDEGLLPSAIVTRSYLIGETVDLPVVSLATDPVHLWDEQTGIYVEGPNASPDPPHVGANYWQDWERPVHIEYFAADGSPGFELDGGVKIHGGYSRSYPQKSLRLLARRVYGTEAIEYPLFAERELVRFKRLILRNAGNDWFFARLRDGFWHRAAAATGLDRQAFAPCVLFLNGAYWGIHNLRERLDRFYLESHHGIDRDRVDLLEDQGIAMEGNSDHYFDMLGFIALNDPAEEQNFQVVETMMEVDNYAEYYVFEIYSGNWDWPHNNVKYWRPATPGGRWRWFLFDIDGGLWDYYHNSLAAALRDLSPNFLFRSLMQNDGFRQRFINRYADQLNSTFLPERLQGILDEIRQTLEAEMPRHTERWEFVLDDWYEDVQEVEDFVAHRPLQARAQILAQFDLTGTYGLSLDVEPHGGGRIDLTAIAVDSTWSGTYFTGVPVSLSAVPAPGFLFTGWSDTTLAPVSSVVVDPAGNYSVTAIFSATGGPVALNEINYHSHDQFDPGDWVELVNAGQVEMDLSGWQFLDSDDAHVFTLPPDTHLGAGDHLVLCRDLTAFSTLFPGVTVAIGNLGFGLSGAGELLRLFDIYGQLVDRVEYDDVPPWPPEPDGGGPTLELFSAGLDNALPASWLASLAPHGTPGERNSVSPAADMTAAPGTPIELRLWRPRPNPFNPATRLGFDLPAAESVRYAIYDASGRLVRLLLNRRLEAGRHRLDWDGRDDRQGRVASGVYFQRLVAGERVLRGKVVLLK